MGKDKNVLYLGNLRRDLHVADLKNNLLDLFCEYIGIEIHWNDIEIKKGKNAWFAFVDLHNEREASETLEELASWENRKHLRYNFLHIVPPLESLAVDYKKMKKVKKNKKDKNENENEDKQASGSKSKTGDGKSLNDISSNQDKPQSTGPEKSSQNKVKNAKKSSQGPDKANHDKKPKDGSDNSPSKKSTPNGAIPAGTEAAVISTSNGGPNVEGQIRSVVKDQTQSKCKENQESLTVTTCSSVSSAEQGVPSSYRVGQSLGSETRNKEFKLGGGNYQKRVLWEHVCKYTCGFLNSGEPGRLYIGVDDNGTVIGLDIDHGQEDDCRLTIDEAMKAMKPSIFPDMYSVHFVPVVSDSDKKNSNLKVIEIRVKAVEDLDVLYSSNDNVFIRRDGSVQGPLKGTEIQEWTKKKCDKDTTE